MHACMHVPYDMITRMWQYGHRHMIIITHRHRRRRDRVRRDVCLCCLLVISGLVVIAVARTDCA